MGTKLSELFRATGGRPLDWGGLTVRMIYEISGLLPGDSMTVRFLKMSPKRAQAVRIKTRNGRLLVADQMLEDIVLWSDTSPQSVVVGLQPTLNAHPMSVGVWNAWRDGEGTMQAWIGNSGMLVEDDTRGAVLLRCSDGFGEPTFDDLVVRLEIGPELTDAITRE